MNKLGIFYSTKDRCELTRQSIEPLLQWDKFALHWGDGSKTDEGKKLHERYNFQRFHRNVTGGSGAAIIYGLTTLLEAGYELCGLAENDVVLGKDWLEPTLALFEQGKADGLEVGAVTARCYTDRVLFQRPNYAVLHNAGAGFIIMTREAAQLVLQTYRTQWTGENRQTFSLLAGVDLARYWAFRGSEHFLVCDWRWDSLLARHGLASLALTPSPVTMIGQVPPLEEQGLTIATGPVTDRIDDKGFEYYRAGLAQVRSGNLKLPSTLFHRDQIGSYTIFAHQIGALGGTYQGKWKLKDSIGFGPFGWIADSHQEDWDPRITIPIFGPCEILVGGGKEGGQVHIVDEQTGFVAKPVLPPEGPEGQIGSANIPGNVAYRNISIKMMTPGSTFYGIRTRDEQPTVSNWKFDWNTLPHGRTEL